MSRIDRPVGVRVGTSTLAAMMLLALSALLTRGAGLAAVERSQTAQTSTGADVRPTTGSAKEVRGATPYIELKNEPAPKLIVDPPLPDLLDQGVVWIQWRAENVHILPVFGKGALSASPRIGHLHVHVDDLPWWWADPSNVNTIDLAGMPPGPHKILIELVDANHEVFPGQSKMVTFTVAKGAPRSHGH
jgi:uncharacterized protein DUF6130